MNLSKINEALGELEKAMGQQPLSEIDWLYEKQVDMQSFSVITQDNIEDYIDILFSSTRTNRMWKNEANRAGELMQMMVEFDPDMVATSMKELFEEGRDLEGRLDRFKFYMDELLRRLRRHQTIKESWHHQDNAILSYYLSMRYPTDYTYYTPENHQLLVDLTGAKPIGPTEDPVRYQKMAKTVSTFLSKNEKLQEAHLKRFRKPVVAGSRLMVLELIDLWRGR